MPVWDEDTLKPFQKSLRSLVPVRDLLWRGEKLGVWDPELVNLIRSKDEFLNSEVRELAEPMRRYLALAQSKLVRPALLVLRSVPLEELPFGKCNDLFLPLLAALGSFLLVVRHLGRPTERSAMEWEALLSAPMGEAKQLKEEDLKKFVSPLAIVWATAGGGQGTAPTTATQPRHEDTKGGRGGAAGRGGGGGGSGRGSGPQKREREALCFVCSLPGHFARECPSVAKAVKEDEP
jgi:hypothetical protein